jgi:hypothetical protein
MRCDVSGARSPLRGAHSNEDGSAVWDSSQTGCFPRAEGSGYAALPWIEAITPAVGELGVAE